MEVYIRNSGRCAETKAWANVLSKALENNKSKIYKFFDHTFKHLIMEKSLKTMNISRLSRTQRFCNQSFNEFQWEIDSE